MGLFDYLFKDKLIAKWVNHRNIYLLGIAVILSGIAWSNFLMSLGQFIVAGNWLLELSLYNKLKITFKDRLFWLLSASYFILLIGLFWTEDYDFALHDIRIKLPLFLLPFLLVSAKPINPNEWKGLLAIYIASLFILNLVSYFKLTQLYGVEIIDKRQLSIKISHIRYGLNIAFAAILCFYYSKLYGIKLKFLMFIMTLWFIICLIMFQLYTGLICLTIVATIIGIYRLFTSKKRWLQLIISSGLLLMLLFSIQVYRESKRDFYSKIELNYDQNDTKKRRTANGEKYWHDLKNGEMENGVFVKRFIAWKELEKAWNKKSNIDFRGKDLKGQHIPKTIFRYLSSKGLKKDSIGFSKLNETEIEAIEKGIANVYYTVHNPIKNRIYSIFYELTNYEKTGYADGYSLAMRIEYWKVAFSIIQSNFFIGVGTGDSDVAILEQFNRNKSSLKANYRKRTHNQYLSVWISVGLIGLILFIFSLIYPLFIVNKKIFMLYLSFLTIVMISFLTEDTLETQAGVTFYTLFNCLFLFGMKSTQSQTSS